MANHTRQSILCPGCRKLISTSETRCPYCDLAAPGSRVISTWFRLGRDADQFINAIVWVNAGMYLIAVLLNLSAINFSLNPLTFLAPAGKSLFLLGATGALPIGRFDRWWTLVSASYLHGGILHIVFNMIALRQLGPLVAREYGVFRMFTIYTLAGVAGFMLSYLAGIPLTIGASASVCGLIGAALFYGKHRGGDYGQAVYRHVGGWVVSLFLFGFMVPGINNWGHGGGLAAGLLCGLIFGYREWRPVNFTDKILAGAAVLLTGLVLSWAVASGLYYQFLS